LKLAVEFPPHGGQDGTTMFKLISPMLLDADPRTRSAALKVLRPDLWGAIIIPPIKSAWQKFPDDPEFRQAAAQAIYKAAIHQRI
jgi:hypothetical protein